MQTFWPLRQQVSSWDIAGELANNPSKVLWWQTSSIFGKPADTNKYISKSQAAKVIQEAESRGVDGTSVIMDLDSKGYFLEWAGESKKAFAKQEWESKKKEAIEKQKSGFRKFREWLYNFQTGVVAWIPESLFNAGKFWYENTLGRMDKFLDSLVWWDSTKGTEWAKRAMEEFTSELYKAAGADEDTAAAQAGEFVGDLATSIIATRNVAGTATSTIKSLPAIAKLVSKYPWLNKVVSAAWLSIEWMADAEVFSQLNRWEWATWTERAFGAAAWPVLMWLWAIAGATRNTLKWWNPTEMLTKAIKPRIASLSKSSSAQNALGNVEDAGKLIVKYADELPTDTASQVTAWKQSMNKVWKQIDDKLGGWANTTIKGDDLAKVVEDYIDNNPALKMTAKNDVKKLREIADGLRAQWDKNVMFWENAKQYYNASSDWDNQDITKTVKNVYKEISKTIWNQLDNKLSSIPWEFADLKREYGTLRSLYDDVWKSNVVAQRKAGKWLYETFGRIDGMWDIVNGLAWFVTWQWSLSQVAKGATKMIMWQQAQKLIDPDYLIRTAYYKLANELWKEVTDEVTEEIIRRVWGWVDDIIEWPWQVANKIDDTIDMTGKPMTKTTSNPMQVRGMWNMSDLEIAKMVDTDVMWVASLTDEVGIGKWYEMLDDIAKKTDYWRENAGNWYDDLVFTKWGGYKNWKDVPNEADSFNKVSPTASADLMAEASKIPVIQKAYWIDEPLYFKKNPSGWVSFEVTAQELEDKLDLLIGVGKTEQEAIERIARDYDVMPVSVKIERGLADSMLDSKFIEESIPTPSKVYRWVWWGWKTTGTAKYWNWLYTTPQRKNAEKFVTEWWELIEMGQDAIPKSPLQFNNAMDYENRIEYDVLPRLWLESERELYSKYWDISTVIRQMWADWVTIWPIDDMYIVKYTDRSPMREQANKQSDSFSKAGTATSDLMAEARKYKSADEFVEYLRKALPDWHPKEDVMSFMKTPINPEEIKRLTLINEASSLAEWKEWRFAWAKKIREQANK